jgi:hypothetical protein
MALKYTLESIEELAEPLREHYREEGGKWFLEAEGMKASADFDRVQNALLAERKEKKDYKDKHSAWETRFTGKTPEEIAAQIERIPVLEAESSGKIDQKKLAEITEIQVRQRMTPLEHENGKLKQTISEHEQVINQFKQNERRRTLHDAVRGVAAKEGYQESAYANSEGALMLLAERNFTITDSGDIIVADESKILTPGLGLREAMVEVKNLYPYLVKNSMGGGAAGSPGTPGGVSSNPFKSDNLTDRAKFMQDNKKDPAKIEFAWKQAGLKGPLELHRNKAK